MLYLGLLSVCNLCIIHYFENSIRFLKMDMLTFSGEELGGTSNRAITKCYSHLLVMIDSLNE